MKLISLSPTTTEILFALGVEDDILAVTRDCNYPNKAKSLQTIGAEIDIKELKKMLPTHVLTYGDQEKLVPKLEKFTKVYHYAPTTLQEVFDGIAALGQFIGKDSGALYLVQQMQEEMAKIALTLPKEKKNVYCEQWHNPPTAAGFWIPDIIAMAGGVSFVASGKKSKKATPEQVEKFNPDIMVIAWQGLGNSPELEEVKQRIGWEAILKAVPIVILDAALFNRPGPRLAEGYKQLVTVLHKKRDTFDDAMDILDGYYEDTKPMDPWKEIADECCSQGHPGQQKHEDGDRKQWLPKIKK